ncbi:MAG: cell division protein FtsZ, partial [Opitutaceae bacterium]|nr:cell division protein FtsZ [Opitutaceae bacterium]
IDEDMQGKVEVVVLGTSDIGARAGGAARRPSTLARPTRAMPAPAARPAGELPIESETAAAAPTDAKSVPVETRVKSSAKVTSELPLTPVAQDEFAFNEVESRGHFDKTDRNLFEGQDLDVPTYLRKGIRLAL